MPAQARAPQEDENVCRTREAGAAVRAAGVIPRIVGYQQIRSITVAALTTCSIFKEDTLKG